MDEANGFSVKSHFEGKDPVVRQIYDALLKHARKFGAVIEDPKKIPYIWCTEVPLPVWPLARPRSFSP